MIADATSNFLTVNIGTNIPSVIFGKGRWWRIKIKNKRTKDRHRAMHPGMTPVLIYFFFHPLLKKKNSCCFTLMSNLKAFLFQRCQEWPCCRFKATPIFSFHFLPQCWVEVIDHNECITVKKLDIYCVICIWNIRNVLCPITDL